jgi:exoribonuclease-2
MMILERDSADQLQLIPERLVQFDDEGEVVLAVVVGTNRDRLIISTVNGREIELIKQRLYPLPAKLNGAAEAELASRCGRLVELSREISEAAASFDVVNLWSYLQPKEERVFTVAELCALKFGANEVIQHAALRVALIKERVHFRRDRNGFEPRAAQLIDDLRREHDLKASRAALRERALQLLSNRVNDSALVVPEELKDTLRLIEEVAAGVVHTEPERQREGREFVHIAAERLGIPESMPLERRAFAVLTSASIFDAHTNLALIRHSVPEAHLAECELAASSLNIPESVSDYPEGEVSFRRDLTQVEVFTIDDASTRDMDDALSLERTREGGYLLGIHITDASMAVRPGSVFDNEAKRRATSIYCADRTINMLPDRLAEDLVSLRAGQVRPALSILVKLSDSFELLSSEVCASFIRSSVRYTYDDVNLLFDGGDARLLALHDIAAACEERRIRSGAMRVQKREVVPFYEHGRVRLLELDEECPARVLVSEMMVLANSILADFAYKNSIPVLYRGQDRPRGEPQSDNSANGEQNDSSSAVAIGDGGSYSGTHRRGEQAPQGPAKDFSVRLRLKRSSSSFEPTRHAGLGLKGYIQATSPIRRYIDLCHQRQFISYLKSGRPWITRREFEEIVNCVELPLQAANLASRETRRYWLLRYLEQRGVDKSILGTVVRVDVRIPIVELEEVYITVAVKFARRVGLGERVNLKLNVIDPHSDTVKLSEV